MLSVGQKLSRHVSSDYSFSCLLESWRKLISSWLNGVDKTIKHQTLMGVCVLYICWSLWLCRNDIVFDKSKVLSFILCRFYLRLHIAESIKKLCEMLAVLWRSPQRRFFAGQEWRFTHGLC